MLVQYPLYKNSSDGRSAYAVTSVSQSFTPYYATDSLILQRKTIQVKKLANYDRIMVG